MFLLKLGQNEDVSLEVIINDYRDAMRGVSNHRWWGNFDLVSSRGVSRNKEYKRKIIYFFMGRMVLLHESSLGGMVTLETLYRRV